MRKIYLLITAAMLLLSSSTLWARPIASVGKATFDTDNYEGNESKAFKAALDAWENGTTLQLLDNCVYETAKYYDVFDEGTSGSKTLDLNGRELTWTLTDGTTCIYPNDGQTLNIVDNSGSNEGHLIFSSEYGVRTWGKTAVLNISNCKVSGSGVVEKDDKGKDVWVGSVLVNVIGTINIENAEIVSTNSGVITVYEGACNVTGESTLTTFTTENRGAITMVGSANDVADYSVLSIGDDVTVSAPNANGICIFGIYDTTSGCYDAYGVKVDMKGTTSSKSFCISTNGNMIAKEGNLPEINVSGKLTSTNEAAIYAAGYAIWNLVGAEVTGAEGIYAKSGTVNISGGTVTATGAVGPATSNCNGNSNTGDAIIMDTNECYAGAVLLNIYGDAKITSTNGYAIQEVITNGTTSSAAGLAISGDETFLGGRSGSVKMSNEFAQALTDGSSTIYDWVLNGVSSGIYSSKPTVVADGYEAVQIEDPEDPHNEDWKVVVKEETPASKVYTIFNKGSEMPETILKNNSELIVKTGATLSIPGIKVEDTSKVTIEAGGEITIGEEGFETVDSNSLIIKADKTNGTGVLLFKNAPENTQPEGTVELYLLAKKNQDGTYGWQHFGVPTTEKPEITKTAPVSYKDWDVINAWIYNGGSASITAPWVGHNVTTSAETEGTIMSFSGTLVGNTDATLNLNERGYNCLANSFTSPISVKSLVNGIEDGLTTDGYIWINVATTEDFVKLNKASFLLGGDYEMAPMQGFFLLNYGSAPISINIPYSDVFNYGSTRDAFEVNGGIISLNDGQSTASVQIVEADMFSDEFENGYDGYQMPTNSIQIYVVEGDSKLAALATNSVKDKEIEIVTKSATLYSLKFSNLNGKAFKLTDLLSGEEIEVSENSVYQFTAEPNSTLRRFKLGEGEVSAEEADADAVKVWFAENALNIAGAADGDAIEVINLAGVKVLSATATGEAVQTISLNGIANGAYIVKAGAATVKVIK